MFRGETHLSIKMSFFFFGGGGQIGQLLDTSGMKDRARSSSPGKK